MNRFLAPKEFDKEFNMALLLELQERLAQMTKERDDIQLRLHAIDHAYNEQQRSENKLILEQQETIRRQRKFIRTLYTSRKARKSPKAPQIASKVALPDDTNPYGSEMQIASCRAVADRWMAIGGLSDKQALLEIIEILREIPE